MSKLRFFFGTLVVLVGGVVHADEGRVPIYQPTTITQPGYYIVTRDISSSTDVIVIQASRVVLDLNGHTVAGTGSSLTNTIRIDPGFADIIVRNGTISVSGGYGVYYSSSTLKTHLRLDRIRLAGNTSQWGVWVSGAESFDLVDSEFVTPGSHCMSVGGGGAIMTGSITNSTFRCGNSNGIWVSGGGGFIIRDNRLYGPVGGIVVSGTGPGASQGVLIENNSISVDQYLALQIVGSGHTVRGNTIRSGMEQGIYVAGDENLITGNMINRCRLSGIYVSGSRNVIESNVSEGTLLMYGLEFVSGSANVYKNNTLRNNAAGPISGAAGNTDGGGNFP